MNLILLVLFLIVFVAMLIVSELLFSDKSTPRERIQRDNMRNINRIKWMQGAKHG